MELELKMMQKYFANLFQDSERLKQHEELEAETIKASVHRHKLAPFAEEIENEIRGLLFHFFDNL